MRGFVLAAGLASVVASCGQPAGDTGNQTQIKPAAPKKKIPYCFFQSQEMKSWSAKRGKDGNIIVKGKVYREDSRYQAILKPAVVSGAHAELSPDLQQNGTGFGAPDNWWEVSQTIPNSAAVDTVDVTCGGKTVADFKLKPKG